MTLGQYDVNSQSEMNMHYNNFTKSQVTIYAFQRQI